MHMERLKRTGSTGGAARLVQQNKGKKCQKCDREATTRGLCDSHYVMMRYYEKQKASGWVSKRPRGRKCSVCGQPHFGRGYCKKHYRQSLTLSGVRP